MLEGAAWQLRHLLAVSEMTLSRSSEVQRETKALMYSGLNLTLFVCTWKKVLVLCYRVRSSCVLKGVSFQDESIPFFICVFSSQVTEKFQVSCVTPTGECFASLLAKRCGSYP